MGDIKGFLKFKRETGAYRPVCERRKDYREVIKLRRDTASRDQASRCMDCGTPFCHWGCPVGNYIPEWNDLLSNGQWERAMQLLHAANNFPEITGRLCPALCEYACALGINDDPVTIRENELALVEHAFKKGYIKPHPPKHRTGKAVAVAGSGAAGLACADQLNKAGHRVTVFERDAKVGGILRYGIPDFKLEKRVIDRRIDILKREGIKFLTGTEVGTAYPASRLNKEFDAAVLAGGSRIPRDLNIEGRGLKGIYFAMDYLIQSNRKASGDLAGVVERETIDAKDKNVVVIGGGDTGADCVGTANRQGAKCVIQIEVMPRPSECRTDKFPWPGYPLLLKTTSSHEEGGERKWAILTKKFTGMNGRLTKMSCVEVDFSKADARGCPVMQEVPGSEFEIETDMAIIAVGFLHPEHKGIVSKLGLELDGRGNVKTGPDYMTSIDGIFSCGDMRRGQSLIVWAISEGRQAAYWTDRYLMGASLLPLI